MKIAVALAGLALTVSGAFAADLPDLGGKEIVVVTENAYPPLQFTDKDGKAIGWEYDAMADLAKKLNFTVKYENTSWDAMIPAVSEGQYDLGMTGITIKEDRKEKVDFSDAYMRSEMVMLVRGDEARFADPAAFAGDDKLLIAAQPGTTPFYTAVYEVLDGNEANPRIKLFETFGATVEALKAGDVDLVLTDGTEVSGFTCQHGTGDFLLTHPKMQVPEETSEFAINTSRYRHWDASIRRYVDECVAGEEGPRGRSFNMRWTASMVAEIHRILTRGGVFLYPADRENRKAGGKLRLMYEANPMAMIIEQAGGAATTGLAPILDIAPTGPHQRVPVILGSKAEVARLIAYHETEKA